MSDTLTLQQVLTSFAIIFASGALAAKLAQISRIPDIALFLLSGIVLGPALNLVTLPADSLINQLVFILGACFLLFHGGLNVKISILRSVWITVLLLATIGTIGMILIVGLTAYAALPVNLITALLLAAVIAPTDPAALIPLFLSVRVKERLAQTVIAESAFNDATGSIMVFTLLTVLTTGEISAIAVLKTLLITSAGGILIGCVYGIIAGFLISDRSKNIFGEYAQILTLPLIMAAYTTAQHFDVSGFMAVFISGIIYGNLAEFGWTTKRRHHVDLHSFIHIGSLLMRMTIFILLGTLIDFQIIIKYLFPASLILLSFVFVARPIVVLSCTVCDRRAKWLKNEIIFMSWTRETGVIPAALAGVLASVPHGDMITAVTAMAILFTILLQASTTKWLADKLQLTKAGPNK